MLKITLNINLDDIIDDISNLAKKQIPYAAYLALNNSVYKSSIKVKESMPPFIEGGPVAFTARGVQYEKAKSKRTLVASVFIPLPQWKYMQWVVKGGAKRWGKSKFGIGEPIYENTKFNRYGNIPGRRRKEKIWRSTLAGMRGTHTVVQGRLGKNQFMIKLPSGDYALMQRTGKGKTRILMIFTHKPVQYKGGQFPFHKLSTRYVTRYFPKMFNKKLREIVARESKQLKVK